MAGQGTGRRHRSGRPAGRRQPCGRTGRAPESSDEAARAVRAHGDPETHDLRSGPGDVAHRYAGYPRDCRRCRGPELPLLVDRAWHREKRAVPDENGAKYRVTGVALITW